MNVLRMIELEKYLKGELEINAFDNDDVMYLYLAQKMPIEDVISYIAYIHSKKINIDISKLIIELLNRYDLSKEELGKRFRDVYAIREYKKNEKRQQRLVRKKKY